MSNKILRDASERLNDTSLQDVFDLNVPFQSLTRRRETRTQYGLDRDRFLTSSPSSIFPATTCGIATSSLTKTTRRCDRTKSSPTISSLRTKPGRDSLINVFVRLGRESMLRSLHSPDAVAGSQESNVLAALRILGLGLIIAALVVAAISATHIEEPWSVMAKSLGELWAMTQPGSLDVVQTAAQQQHLPSHAWDQVLLTFLRLPAWLMAAILGPLSRWCQAPKRGDAVSPPTRSTKQRYVYAA
jgi:hypothetical protein